MRAQKILRFLRKSQNRVKPGQNLLDFDLKIESKIAPVLTRFSDLVIFDLRSKIKWPKSENLPDLADLRSVAQKKDLVEVFSGRPIADRPDLEDPQIWLFDLRSEDQNDQI